MVEGGRRSAFFIGMKKLSEVKKDELKNIKALCFDIDDTFSSEGKITPEAFSALWKLKEAGFILVPVTGRPAGWCDMIARFWPVDAVIGENGAFVFFMKNGVRSRMDVLDEFKASEARCKITWLKDKVLEEFPHAQWASDQEYREYDLAIDFCEDVKPWREDEIDDLVSHCENLGAIAKISSIHVNAWFGDYNKQMALRVWLERGAPGLKGKVPSLDEWIYAGDSPNDEPAFEFFKQSVGVANLSKFLKKMKTHPTYITEGESGRGFSELALKLIESRN